MDPSMCSSEPGISLRRRRGGGSGAAEQQLRRVRRRAGGVERAARPRTEHSNAQPRPPHVDDGGVAAAEGVHPRRRRDERRGEAELPAAATKDISLRAGVVSLGRHPTRFPQDGDGRHNPGSPRVEGTAEGQRPARAAAGQRRAAARRRRPHLAARRDVAVPRRVLGDDVRRPRHVAAHRRAVPPRELQHGHGTELPRPRPACDDRDDAPAQRPAVLGQG
eukprot:gene10214-biopygen11919